MNTLFKVHLNLWQSFRRLPLWVQLWMAAILLPVNLASLLLLHYSSSQWIALSAFIVVASNMLLMYTNGGFSRLLAVPHLLIWGPLQVILLMYLAQSRGPLTSGEVLYVSLVLVVNGISLVFDLIDTWRWIKGERELF